jgi:hypothetical protein
LYNKEDQLSNIQVEFKKKRYKGWVTIAKEGRKTPAYRLWYSNLLSHELKDGFLMSFVRDFASVLDNKGDIDSFKISEYKLTNSKIDSN